MTYPTSSNPGISDLFQATSESDKNAPPHVGIYKLCTSILSNSPREAPRETTIKELQLKMGIVNPIVLLVKEIPSFSATVHLKGKEHLKGKGLSEEDSSLSDDDRRDISGTQTSMDDSLSEIPLKVEK